MARNAAARAPSDRCGDTPRKTKRSLRMKFQTDEHWVASNAAASTLKPRPPRNSASASELTAMPLRPTRPKRPKRAPSVPRRRRQTSARYRETSRTRGLALARRTHAEAEGNLRDREPGRAHEDLEQDLEAIGTQGIQVERVAAHEEEARQRIA